MPATLRRTLIGFGMLTAAWMLIPLASAAGDPAEGAKAFRVCTACHSRRPDVNMTGPSLTGIWGRKAGSLPSFSRYSPALRQSGLVWNERTLDEWLADPAGFIPNNCMTIQDIADAKQRADLTALLGLASPNGPAGAAIAAPEVIEPNLKSQPATR